MLFKILCLISFFFYSAANAGSRQLILDIGNDFFALPKHTDRYLTNNITFGVVDSGLPWYLNSFDDDFEESVQLLKGWSVSQYIYTPENTSLEIPHPWDQPYAGWLYLSNTIGIRKLGQLFLYELQAGIVGPSAKAKETQDFYHDLIEVDRAHGWDSQLHDELGVNLGFTYAILAYRSQSEWGGDFITSAGGSLGNVDTHAEVAALIRWGRNVPDDMGYRAGSPPKDVWSAFTFIRGQQRFVIRDIFLDGNTDGKSASVEKRTLIGMGSVGATLGYDGFEFSYSFDAGSKRFKTQSSAEVRGSLSFSFSRYF